jgi:hypothetical protein
VQAHHGIAGTLPACAASVKTQLNIDLPRHSTLGVDVSEVCFNSPNVDSG